jgi:hypothetical protein
VNRSVFLGRAVIDRTGFTGAFDVSGLQYFYAGSPRESHGGCTSRVFCVCRRWIRTDRFLFHAISGRVLNDLWWAFAVLAVLLMVVKPPDIKAPAGQ